MVSNHLKLINEQRAKIAQACTNTKAKLHRTNAAICFNKLCLYALVGRIFRNNQTVFQVRTSVYTINAMFCLQNDTLRILYAYHSDDPILRTGTKFGTLSYHGTAQRGFRTMYLMERINLEKPVPRDLLFWDLKNPVVSTLKFYQFREIHETQNIPHESLSQFSAACMFAEDKLYFNFTLPSTLM